MSTTHDLKVWPEFFDAILDGRKTFEVRNTHDRDFAVGDTLRLREWTHDSGERPGAYTGREVARAVSYIVRGAPFLPADLAVLGIIDDVGGASAEHWRAEYVKQVNLRHERNKESDARLAAVTAERDAALARTERWKQEHESIRVDFAALVQKEMTLRAQVESALGGKTVESPVSDAVILAQRVAQEREVAVRDGEAIRKAIGLDADASTTSVLARLAETHPDLLASGERATFLRRSGAEMAKREMVLLCWNRCQAETDPERVNALRATFNAMASVDLGAVEDLATLPAADYSILRDSWASMLRRHQAAAEHKNAPCAYWIASRPHRQTYTYGEMAEHIESRSPVGEEYLRETLNAIISTRVLSDAHLAELLGAGFNEGTYKAANRVVAERNAAVSEAARLRGEVEAVTAERDRLQRACDEGLPREYIECPACGKQHLEWFRHDAPGIDGRKRPHHTHRCYHCEHVWDSGRWSFGADVPKPAEHAAALATARREGAEEMRERCSARCEELAEQESSLAHAAEARGDQLSAAVRRDRAIARLQVAADIRALPLDAPGGET